MKKPHVIIISPALANANNGNWQTARRWADFLRPHYRIECATTWNAARSPSPVLMIALHARRSAAAIAAFSAAFPHRPLVLVLTGTDLYRDIRGDAAAQRSLELASRLVVLQEAGLDELEPRSRDKALVIHQSAPTLAPRTPTSRTRGFKVIMIGHLRDEKQPATFMQAASLLTTPDVRLVQLGAALDPALGDLAARTQAVVPRYAWIGPRTHAQARQHLRRSDLMVLPSAMEGGANVIIEAVTSGVPVLASDIAGNRGMLGADYLGYFPTGDGAALARLIDLAASDAAFLAILRNQCAARAGLFSPVRERAAVVELVDNCLLHSSRRGDARDQVPHLRHARHPSRAPHLKDQT